MKRRYQNPPPRDTRKLVKFFSSKGELFLPFVEMIETSSSMVSSLLETVSRAAIEAVLNLSAARVAGPWHQGRPGGDILRHGRQKGVVTLAERKVRVRRPRLRQREGGEVEIPAYEALRSNPRLQERIWELLMQGVSTRNYESVIPEMAETVGVKKSSVSRGFVEASAESIKKLARRRLDELEILVIYLDGVVYGEHHVLAALGVDRSGKKHVLGLTPGASENLEASIRLLEDLVARGLDPRKRYLFVIDGAKALRSAVRRVYGTKQRIQRCRLHKIRNVLRELPKELGQQVVSVMRAAFRMDADDGIAKLRKQAAWLKTEYPGAAASLQEGLEEMFTVSRMGLSSTLTRCLVSTNIIESPFGTIQQVTGRVRRWRSGEMVTRWAASAMLAAETRFRRIMGYKQLWQLEAALREDEATSKKQAA